SVLILSLGLQIVMESGLTLIYGPSLHTFPGFSADVVILGPVFVTSLQWSSFLALIVTSTLLLLFLRLTRLGQGILAVGDSREMALVVGIDTERVSVVVFALGSAISAVAGTFTLLNEGATPTMGFYPVFIAFVVAVVGGLGSIPGAVAGGFMVGLTESL